MYLFRNISCCMPLADLAFWYLMACYMLRLLRIDLILLQSIGKHNKMITWVLARNLCIKDSASIKVIHVKFDFLTNQNILYPIANNGVHLYSQITLCSIYYLETIDKIIKTPSHKSRFYIWAITKSANQVFSRFVARFIYGVDDTPRINDPGNCALL
jgi:hypothetical protein